MTDMKRLYVDLVPDVVKSSDNFMYLGKQLTASFGFT